MASGRFVNRLGHPCLPMKREGFEFANSIIEQKLSITPVWRVMRRFGDLRHHDDTSPRYGEWPLRNRPRYGEQKLSITQVWRVMERFSDLRQDGNISPQVWRVSSYVTRHTWGDLLDFTPGMASNYFINRPNMASLLAKLEDSIPECRFRD